MKKKFPARLALDAAMTFATLLALAFRITGDFAHEFIGIAALALFAFHNILNRRWFCEALKGKYGFRRLMNAAVNAPLILSALLVFATGLMQSKHIPDFLQFSEGMAARRIHSAAAYWMFALISAHIGLNFGAISSKIGLNKRCAILMPRIACLLLAAFGIWAWKERAMTEKLFMGYSFDFWNPESPQILFFAENFGVMCLVAASACFTVKLSDMIKSFKTLKNER